MEIQNLNKSDILNNKNINLNFISAELENLSMNCNIYNGNFYLDSLNYFPITEDNYSFLDIFGWKEKFEYDHFFKPDFYSNFVNNYSNLICCFYENFEQRKQPIAVIYSY